MRNGEGNLGDEALDWVARLHSGRATRRDRRAFAQWRTASAAHEAAAREAETLWQEIGETAVAVEFRAATGHVRSARPMHSPLTRRTVIAGAAIASVASVVVASGALGPVSGLFSDYATGIGERRRIHLPDGSIAELNSASALSVAYTEAERRLTLNAGEAVFDVQKDPARPFTVAAGAGQTRAVGTVFGVRRLGEDVGVTVEEGIVEVSLGDGGADLMRVVAGQGVRYGAGRFLGAAETEDVTSALAWRRGKLIFNQRPLAAVVAELERYQFERIVIADAALRDLPVTGVFDLTDPAGTLRTIEQTLQVKVLRLPFVTVLR